MMPRRARPLGGETDARARLLALYEAKIAATADKVRDMDSDIESGVRPASNTLAGPLTRLRTILAETEQKAAGLRMSALGNAPPARVD
jgi:hypothetical protein